MVVEIFPSSSQKIKGKSQEKKKLYKCYKITLSQIDYIKFHQKRDKGKLIITNCHINYVNLIEDIFQRI